jgi:hypothetical protein
MDTNESQPSMGQCINLDDAIAMQNLDLIIHLLPRKLKIIYENVNEYFDDFREHETGDFYDYLDDCEDDHVTNRITLITWAAENSTCLFKNIIEKMSIESVSQEMVDTAFKIACHNNNLELASYLLSNFNPDCMPISWAPFETFKYLSDTFNKLSIDSNRFIERKLFIDTISSGTLSMVQYIMEKVNILNLKSKRNRVWKYACANTDVDVLRYILTLFKQQVRKFVITSDFYDQISLEAMKFLVEEHQLTMDEINRETGLTRLCRNGNRLPIIKYLVERFNLTPKDFTLHCILMCIDVTKYFVDTFNLSFEDVCPSDESCDLVLLKYFVEKFDLTDYDVTKTFTLDAIGDIETFRFITERVKFDPTSEEIDQFISNASFSGDLEMVRYIVDKWSSSNPLMINRALDNGKLDVVKYFVENFGTKQQILYSKSRHRYRDLALVTYIGEHFPSYDIRHHDNYALCHVCETGNLEVLKYIVDRYSITKEDIKCRGNYPLRIAIVNNHLGVVSYIIETFNLSIHEAGIGGITLDLACSRDNFEVVKYLFDKFDISSHNTCSKYVLRFALSYGKKFMLRDMLN